ncbi:MAG: SLBB domain-containing protein [Nocardiopsaceae bacterium]|nr:SLBB domain-containing protein [Nocardiopsaceae bacterium]
MAELLPGAPVTSLHALGPAEDLAAYQARGGYQALRSAQDTSPDQIITTVREAGLTGRGGAGFPAAAKWEAARACPGPRYLVVNAAEGEPGSYKDRHQLARAPHQVLEGTLIAARATGAAEVIVYINSEFAAAHDALATAIGELDAAGLAATLPPIRLLLENHVYIAGEETALLAVLMGRPAWPWPKPPYPTERGYNDQPTVVNNVETLAHVPLILRRGPDWYRQHQPVLFSVTGDVARPGVFELPLGIPVRDLIAQAGGPLPGDQVAAVLPGGYSLPWLRADQLHLAMEPEALKAAGTGLGASVIVVGAQQGPGLAAARIAAFFARETCQTCPICVTGTARLAQLLRPGADRNLTPAESQEITELAGEHRGKGICTLLDSAATVALASAPHLVGDEQTAAPVA